jgi:predicted Zn-dependent peptidase
MIPKLELSLAHWKGEGVQERASLPLRPALEKKRVYLIDRPNSVQTYVMLANLAIPRVHSDYVACQVMNQILGVGQSSRLFRNLREDKGYTYGVSSAFVAQELIHHFWAAGSFRPEVVGPAVREFLREFEELRNTAVPNDELDRAKRAIVAGFALQLENQANVLRQALQLREYGLSDDYWDDFPSKVMSISATDVQAVARRYLPVDNLQLIAVGDARKIAGALAPYGPIDMYSLDGKKVVAGSQ